jgi:CheY-like chemotaxis protein
MNARVLVVDDNAVNLSLAATLLELEGYAVRQAIDASEALAAVRSEIPELILIRGLQ